VNNVKPDVAICFEGCPADDTIAEPYAVQAALKKGPMLRFMDRSAICNPRFMRYALDLAEEKGITVQAAVREGGGTNASMICLSDKGTPVIVISIPVRYIHSHNCIASMSDFDAAVELAVAVIKSLDKDIVDSF
jgi:putative aminopeptidase FrvX